MSQGPRHKARHFAMQALYQWSINNELPEIIEEEFLEDQPFGDDTDKDYFHELLTGTVSHLNEIDAAYAPYLSRKADDLDSVDRAILRLATYELLFEKKVPFKVVISEAILLAKKFAAQDSHKFVNGVLDKVVHAMVPASDNDKE